MPMMKITAPFSVNSFAFLPLDDARSKRLAVINGGVMIDGVLPRLQHGSLSKKKLKKMAGKILLPTFTHISDTMLIPLLFSLVLL